MKLSRIALFLAVLVMPLQGMAASLSHLFCLSPTAAELTFQNYPEHDTGGSVGAHRHGDNVGGNPADHVEHLSCHQSAIGIPSIALAAFAGVVPVFEPAIFIAPDPFFPEQPTRPPRS